MGFFLTRTLHATMGFARRNPGRMPDAGCQKRLAALDRPGRPKPVPGPGWWAASPFLGTRSHSSLRTIRWTTEPTASETGAARIMALNPTMNSNPACGRVCGRRPESWGAPHGRPRTSACLACVSPHPGLGAPCRMTWLGQTPFGVLPLGSLRKGVFLARGMGDSKRRPSGRFTCQQEPV